MTEKELLKREEKVIRLEALDEVIRHNPYAYCENGNVETSIYKSASYRSLELQITRLTKMIEIHFLHYTKDSYNEHN